MSLVEKVKELQALHPNADRLKDRYLREAETLADLYPDIKPEPWVINHNQILKPPTKPVSMI